MRDKCDACLTPAGQVDKKKAAKSCHLPAAMNDARGGVAA